MTLLLENRRMLWERALRSPVLLAVLLTAGAADLSVLNVFVLPGLLTATDVSASRAAGPELQAPVQVAPKPTLPAAKPAGNTEQTALARAKATAPKAEPAVVLFSHGNWWISPRNREILRELAQKLTRQPGTISIEIDGYADSSGKRSVNDRISELRARSVADELARAGLDRERILLRARGEQAGPIAAFDRRVEVRLGGEP